MSKSRAKRARDRLRRGKEGGRKSQAEEEKIGRQRQKGKDLLKMNRVRIGSPLCGGRGSKAFSETL